MRKKFVTSCEKMIRQGNDSVVILGDIGVYGFRNLNNEFPSRIINLGIMEQSMVGVGAGFASRGIIPTLHSIAPFLIERAFEHECLHRTRALVSLDGLPLRIFL